MTFLRNIKQERLNDQMKVKLVGKTSKHEYEGTVLVALMSDSSRAPIGRQYHLTKRDLIWTPTSDLVSRIGFLASSDLKCSTRISYEA